MTFFRHSITIIILLCICQTAQACDQPDCDHPKKTTDGHFHVDSFLHNVYGKGGCLKKDAGTKRYNYQLYKTAHPSTSKPVITLTGQLEFADYLVTGSLTTDDLHFLATVPINDDGKPIEFAAQKNVGFAARFVARIHRNIEKLCTPPYTIAQQQVLSYVQRFYKWLASFAPPPSPAIYKIHNCTEFWDAEKHIMIKPTRHDTHLIGSIEQRCGALKKLMNVQVARDNFIKTISLTDKKVLSPVILPYQSPEEELSHVNNESKGKAVDDLGIPVKSLSPTSIMVGDLLTISEIARGDFNGDGREDILANYILQLSWGEESGILILTRKQDHGLLIPIEKGIYVLLEQRDEGKPF